MESHLVEHWGVEEEPDDDFEEPDHIAGFQKWKDNSDKLEKARAIWAKFKLDLEVQYPPPGGQDFEFICPHFQELDKVLG